MMQIGKHPFLYHLLWQFLDLGAERIILATANKSEYIHKFVNEKFKAQVLAGKILFSNEKIQSGTGGAILSALDKVQSSVFLVSNADTIIPDLSEIIWSKLDGDMNFLIFLSKMTGKRFNYFNTDDTHIIDLNQTNKLNGRTSSGLVLVKKSFYKNINLKPPLSFENDILKYEIGQRKVGYKMVGDFIDFGVPEDFSRASAQYKNKENSIFR